MAHYENPRFQNLGLLFLRVGIGAMFIFHGYGKLAAGAPTWEKIGSAMGFFGITDYPQIWGLLAALSETLGGVCLILGFLFRPAAFFMFITMVVAANMHLAKGDGLLTASHAIEAGIVFFSLILIGPGRYSLFNVKQPRT